MATNKGDKQANGIVWDTEDRTDLMSEREGHIRDSSIYVTAALWSEMQEAFGGVVTHVKTSTDAASGEVTVARAVAGEAGAVSVRHLGSNAAEFSFFRPLRKLNLKVPANRQFNVSPIRQVIDGVGAVFIFPMAQRRSVPRNRKEETVAGEQQGAAGQQPAQG